MAISRSGESLEKAVLKGLSQKTRPFRVKTSLKDDHVVFRSMRITETLSTPFEMDVEMLSDDPSIDFDEVLGHNLTVGVYRGTGEERFFNGYVTSFGFSGMRGRQYMYRATVTPWLWLLTQTENCRIFHQQSAIDIAKQIFSDHGFADYRVEGDVWPQAYDYCVQYRESDFNFVSRLLEKEGIYYWFEHENGRHTMVIGNSMDAHKTDPGYESVPMVMRDTTAGQFREGIFTWRNRQQLRATHVTLQDYNFVSPRAEMNATHTIARKHAVTGLEMYQYPGEYGDTGLGKDYATIRAEEQQAGFDMSQAETNVRGIRTGYRFGLQDHTVKTLNSDYLTVSSHIECHSGEYNTGSGGGEGELFSCTFTAMPLSGTYRPARTARKPLIMGPQTAIVTNRTEGEEIEPVDSHGRVTVYFEWEREGRLSCPVRVSQAWAGASWGAMMIPRHGQEVIVEFEDGNPDRPIITGRVYNAKNEPPYDPLEKPTVTTFKTSSSKGGAGFNELRFDDLAGEENIFIHAEKSMDIRVKQDRRTDIGNDDHQIVHNDQFLQVDGNKHELVDAESRLEVTDDFSTTVGGTAHFKINGDFAAGTGGAVHFEAGTTAVIEASSGVTLKCGGSFVTLNSGGVFISGSMVNINSGGSALSGPGEAAQAPEEPVEAKNDEPGETSDSRGRSWTPTPKELDSHPVAAALIGGAGSGAPFCAICSKMAGGGGAA